MKYVKSLDGYRAVAVILVIIEHWIPHGNLLIKFPFGSVGVTMFYVLSGFLITSILFSSNDLIREKKIKPIHAFKAFYARRTLRIFPVYYLVIILFVLFYSSAFYFDKNAPFWFITYATNIYMYIRADYIGIFNPFWSLAVEEQFYLAWPLIILFSNQKHFFRIILAIIVSAVLFRILMAHTSDFLRRGDSYVFLTFSCMDSFGVGALLSLYLRNKERFPHFISTFGWLSLFCFPAFVFMFNNGLTMSTLYRPLISICSAFIILLLLDEKRFVSRVFFLNPALVYLGKISYGIYLFHNFVGTFYPIFSKFLIVHGFKIPFTKYSLLPFVGGMKQLIPNFIFLIMAASCSWYFFEKPINNLKRYFKYN